MGKVGDTGGVSGRSGRVVFVLTHGNHTVCVNGVLPMSEWCGRYDNVS